MSTQSPASPESSSLDLVLVGKFFEVVLKETSIKKKVCINVYESEVMIYNTMRNSVLTISFVLVFSKCKGGEGLPRPQVR